VKPGDVPVELMSFYLALENAKDGDEGHFDVTSDLTTWLRTREAHQIVLKVTRRAQ
jgi:hypothetical protein